MGDARSPAGTVRSTAHRGRAARAGSLAADLALLGTSGLRALREDPALLLVQAARRLPARVRRALRPRSPRPGLIAAWRAHLADQPDLARQLLAGREDRAGVLAVQLGLPAADDAVSLARQAVAAGELSRAVALAPGTPVAARAASELRLLAPGFRLRPPGGAPPAPHPTRARPGAGTAAPGPRADQAAGEAAASGPRVAMLLTNSLPHTQSGYAQRSHSLLTALRAEGVQVEAWTRLGWPVTVGKVGVAGTDVIGGVAYHRLRTLVLPHELDRRWQRQADAWARALEPFAPELLHTTTEYPNALVTQAVAARLGVPWVYEMRGRLELSWLASRPMPWRDQAATSEKLALWRAKEAELAAAADAVLVLSQVQADDVVARGVDATCVTVVPNGIDEALLTRDVTPAAARERLGLPADGVWVGSVSSLVGYEGFETLLRAVALARGHGADIRCALVGDGVTRPGLERLGASLHLGDALVIPGRVPRDEALRWYEALDLFAVPRRDTPVCRVVTPMKPLEAMALGRPVVASDLPALREVVSGTGALVAADDAEALADVIVRLAADPGERARLGEAARHTAAARTWRRDAQLCVKMYARLKARTRD